MKRTAILLILALMLTCLSGGALASALTPCSGMHGFEYVYGYVRVYDETYIYDWPDTSSSVIGEACHGMDLDFLGDIHVDNYGREWYRVVDADSRRAGWIREDNCCLFED